MIHHPIGHPISHQNWRDLLFVHWKVDKDEIQKTLPPGLFVDTFQNDAYLSVVFFNIENGSPSYFPAIPGLSNFTEINVRTYVYDENGNRGVWFYSLDINSFLASRIAYLFFSLPYYFGNFTKQILNEMITIKGQRFDKPPLSYSVTFQPSKENDYFAKESTLEFFLLERYALFTYHRNHLNMLCVKHTPYPLKGVKILNLQPPTWEPYTFQLNKAEPDLFHYSPEVDVDIFCLVKITSK